MCTFGSLGDGERFVREIEVANGNGCVYRKIDPRDIVIIRNAVRCWSMMSEFVTFSNSERVVRIVS